MRKILLGAAVFFMCAFAASAQNFTTVTGTITDTNGLPYSNASVTAEIQPAGTNPAVPPPCAGQSSTNCGISGLQRSTADVNGTFSMTLASNAAIIPGGTQWKFTVTITPGIPPPAGTGSQSCFATLTISGASQSVTSSFSACPRLSNTAGGSSGAPSTVIDVKTLGAKADTKFCYGANVTTTNTSQTVGCATASFAAANVGQLEFATDGAGGLLNSQAGLLRCPQGTILSINSAISVQVSIACTFTMSGSGAAEFVYGSDDTAPLSASTVALGALTNCGTVQLPQGAMMNQQPQWSLQSLGCFVAANGLAIQTGAGNRVVGYGPGASIIVNTPSFNFAGAVSGSLFGGNQPFMDFEQWSISGGGLGTNGNNAVTIVKSGTEWQTYQFEIADWLGADANTTGFEFNGRHILTRVQGSGGTGCAAGVLSYVTMSVCNYSKNRALNVGVGQVFNSSYNSFGANPAGTISVLVDGTWTSSHDVIPGLGSPTNNVFLQVNATGVVSLDTDTIGAFAAAQPCIAAFTVTGAKVGSKNTAFTGCANGAAVQNGAGTSFIEQDSGNTYLGSTTLVVNNATASFVPFRAVNGSCTGVGTAASTLGLYGTGPNEVLTTCTSAAIGTGIVMDHAGSLRILLVNTTAAGVNASSGVVTVLKNGAGTAVTCTIGTGTFCQDNTHVVSFVAGDLISYNFTTQAADTLAGVKASVSAY